MTRGENRKSVKRISQKGKKLFSRIICVLVLMGMLLTSGLIVVPVSAESNVTLYFAAPQSWSSSTVKANFHLSGAGDTDGWSQFTMTQQTGKTVTNGSTTYNVYSVTATISGNAVSTIQFQKYDSDWSCQYIAVSSSTSLDSINGKIWVPNSLVESGNSSYDGSWETYNPNSGGNVTLYFAAPQSWSSSTVKANFHLSGAGDTDG